MRRWELDNVEYLDFWPNFKPKDFFLHRILIEELDAKCTAVSSVYPNILKKYLMRLPLIGSIAIVLQALIRRPEMAIWWTGENIKPPQNGRFDLCISFDQTKTNTKNVYFPLFYSELLFPNTDSRNRLGIDLPNPTSLLERRELPTPKYFTCAFVNNPEINRLTAIELLGGHGKIDVFGSLGGRPVEGKLPTGKNYKFVMCFENALSPGYITEKLLDAYLCGAVPLYWGDLGDEPHINRRAFINAKDFNSLDEFATYVGNLSDQEYKKIQNEPLLNSLPSADKLVGAIKKSFASRWSGTSFYPHA